MAYIKEKTAGFTCRFLLSEIKNIKKLTFIVKKLLTNIK